jgi:enhanced filamentous growth protein 1
VMGSMGASDGFQWAPSQGMSGPQGTNPMSIDTGLSNARSMPTTPATTPPGSTLQSMQSYPSATQSYDSSRTLYNPPATQQSPYQPSNPTPQDRSVYGQANSYVKNEYVKSEMGPPSTRPAGAVDQQDTKPTNGIMHPDQTGQQVTQSAEDEADHDHDAEYTHDSGAYDANRASYNYPAPAVGSLSTDHQHLSPEMTGSPNHPPNSGRATPRTAAAPQPYYSQQTGYNTPPRVQAPSSNLYNVMSTDQSRANGGAGSDVYAPQPDMGGSMTNGYSTQAPVMNGGSGGMKRGRDDEDDLPRPSSGGPGMGGLDLKRRKTMMETNVAAPGYDVMNRAAPAISQRRR